MNLEPDRILLPLAGNNQNSLVAQLRVMNDVMPTPQQYAELMDRFAAQRTAVRTSAAGYLTKDGELSDGSRFRIVSNSGMHTVMIWPISPGGSRIRLPHGFAVVTNWHAPFIYKYQTDTGQWVIAPDALPQLTSETVVDGYSQIAIIDKALVYPALRNQKKLQLWDFGPHATPQADSKTYVLPANLQFPDNVGNPQFKPLLTHYMEDYSIVAGSGVLYAVTPPPAIMTDPEPVTPLPGCTDATGTTLALQLVRQAQTSMLNDFWTFRFCNEAITRTAEKSYTRGTRNVVDLLTPINAHDAATDDTTTINNMGVALGITLYSIQYAVSGAVTVGGPPFDEHGSALGGNLLAFYGANRIYTDFTSTASASDTSLLHTHTKGSAGTVTYSGLVALPAMNSVEYGQLEVDLHYPATQYFRGGTKTWSSGYSPASGERGLGATSFSSRRVDAKHDVNATPEVRMNLSWATVKFLEGTVTGKLYGVINQDTRHDYRSGGDLPDYTFATPSSTPPPNVAGTTPEDYYNEWMGEPNDMAGWLGEWNSSPCPQPADTPGAGTSLDTTTVNENTALYCTGSYTYKSRFIIDYDHRSRFYAAIRVEVTCGGARWDQVSGGYQGELAVTTDPSYTAKVYFECNWNGTTSEQLLASDACSRSAFEFLRQHYINVYIYPADDTSQPLDYWTPPELTVSEVVAASIINTTLHQGVNPNLVARMHYDSVPDAMVSVPGIEYTQVNDDGAGNITATLQHAFVDGQLYARTFKLSDTNIQPALWMLSALMMDAPLNNAYPTDGSEPALWHYMPTLGDAINNTTFHIEVRNGIIEQWSDNIPADDPHVVRPAAAAREIALYEI